MFFCLFDGSGWGLGCPEGVPCVCLAGEREKLPRNRVWGLSAPRLTRSRCGDGGIAVAGGGGRGWGGWGVAVGGGFRYNGGLFKELA